MTQFAEAVRAVAEFASQPISSYDSFPQTDAQVFQEACFKNLLTLCRSASPAERNAVLAAERAS